MTNKPLQATNLSFTPITKKGKAFSHFAFVPAFMTEILAHQVEFCVLNNFSTREMSASFVTAHSASELFWAYSTRSNTVAMPWPKPMHMVAKPYFAPLSSIKWISDVLIREPEQPSG